LVRDYRIGEPKREKKPTNSACLQQSRFGTQLALSNGVNPVNNMGQAEKEIPMKTSILRTLATLSLSAALGPVSLMAQGPIHITIPFDFTVGSKSLPAGEYRIGEQPRHVLAIRSVDNRSVMMIMTHSAEPTAKPGEASLTFNRYGDRYFLSQVSSSDLGWELPKSPVEKELAAKVALPQPKPVVLIAQ